MLRQLKERLGEAADDRGGGGEINIFRREEEKRPTKVTSNQFNSIEKSLPKAGWDDGSSGFDKKLDRNASGKGGGSGLQDTLEGWRER